MRQVYKISIGAACNLSWPADRLVIQVLDDSTDPLIKVSISSLKTLYYTSISIYIISNGYNHFMFSRNLAQRKIELVVPKANK